MSATLGDSSALETIIVHCAPDYNMADVIIEHMSTTDINSISVINSVWEVAGRLVERRMLGDLGLFSDTLWYTLLHQNTVVSGLSTEAFAFALLLVNNAKGTLSPRLVDALRKENTMKRVDVLNRWRVLTIMYNTQYGV